MALTADIIQSKDHLSYPHESDIDDSFEHVEYSRFLKEASNNLVSLFF